MKFRLPFSNRSIEIRAAKRPRPDEWDDFWYSVGGGETTKAGIDVTEDTALQLGAVWACVRVIAEDLASLPLFIYRRTGKGKERAMDHPAYRLLHDAPNPEMSAMQLREALQAHILTWGNCYIEIQRNIRGEPIALWPLRPDKMEVERSESNELQYVYSVNSERITFDKSDILHIAGLGFNGLIGYSPITYHRETIGLGMAANEFGSRFFGGDATPRMVLKHPGFLKPEGHKTLGERWQAAYGGSANSGKVAILEGGMDLTTVSIPNADAQYLETRKFEVAEIARIFRVPPHKIGDLERATFSNIEHQGIDYVVSTIRPWAVRWEQSINQRLLNGSEEFFAEHLMDGLLRGDLQSRYAAYAVGRLWGWLSVNDIRSLENMNPIKEGDAYLQPLNMVEVGTENDDTEAGGIDTPGAGVSVKKPGPRVRVFQTVRRNNNAS